MQKLLCFLLVLLVFGACRKNGTGFEEDSALEFSTSQVVFDTVFTGIGSATELFKIYNRSDKDIKISRIFLQGGNSSQFRFNVDGIAGEQRDLVIAGNDSAFAFVEVTVDPGNTNNPFVIEDQLVFITNGQTQEVKTVAWGQDAHYYFPNTRIEGLPSFSRVIDYKLNPAWNDVITWTNDKPHVIYGYLRVDSTFTLKIEKGTQVHLHENAGIWVAANGSIQVEGELEEEVVFQGDRLESNFDEISGQWDRIWINEGAESSFRYAIIKNGYVGIQAETTPFNPGASQSKEKLILQKTIIKNMAGIGLFTRNFEVEAENCLIYNIANQDVALSGGGECSFKHCTFANYWSGSNRQQSLLFAGNAYTDINGETQTKNLNARFENCIIYGNKREEVELDSSLDASYQIIFDHCILKSEIDTSTNPSRYLNCLVNPQNGFNSPVFTNPGGDEYQLYSGSTAQENGNPNTPSSMREADDLLTEMRDSQPDMGCYEYQK